MASRRRSNARGVTGALCLARPATVRRRSRSDDDTAGPNRATTDGLNATRHVVRLAGESVQVCDGAALAARVMAKSSSTDYRSSSGFRMGRTLAGDVPCRSRVRRSVESSRSCSSKARSQTRRSRNGTARLRLNACRNASVGKQNQRGEHQRRRRDLGRPREHASADGPVSRRVISWRSSRSGGVHDRVLRRRHSRSPILSVRWVRLMKSTMSDAASAACVSSSMWPPSRI